MNWKLLLHKDYSIDLFNPLKLSAYNRHSIHVGLMSNAYNSGTVVVKIMVFQRSQGSNPQNLRIRYLTCRRDFAAKDHEMGKLSWMIITRVLKSGEGCRRDRG